MRLHWHRTTRGSRATCGEYTATILVGFGGYSAYVNPKDDRYDNIYYKWCKTFDEARNGCKQYLQTKVK